MVINGLLNVLKKNKLLTVDGMVNVRQLITYNILKTVETEIKKEFSKGVNGGFAL